jgi:hypothetical protein
MAAEVKKIIENKERSLFLLTNDAVGGGETGVTKVDISTLPDVPLRVKVHKICYDARDCSLLLYYDRSAAIRIAVVSGNGEIYVDEGIEDSGSGGTGDIKLSTLGLGTNPTYSALIGFKADV